MRIAILLTDSHPTPLLARHPEDDAKFRLILQPLRPGWDFVTFPVRDGIFPESGQSFDGYIITGSPASVNDDEPWIDALKQTVRRLHAERAPVFGACFGHQLIAAALGGQVSKNPQGWSLGTAVATYTRFAPWMDPGHENIRFYSCHNEQVTRLPPGADVLGTDPACQASSFRIDDHVFTTQQHPEIMSAYMADLLVELGGVCSEEIIERAREKIASGDEGDKFAEWIVNFFEWNAGVSGGG